MPSGWPRRCVRRRLHQARPGRLRHQHLGGNDSASIAEIERNRMMRTLLKDSTQVRWTPSATTMARQRLPQRARTYRSSVSSARLS
jgi:hypothetical protein